MMIRTVGGFTLLELVIVLAIVAILATVAYPSYHNQVLKTRRADAFALMSNVQQAQERWRAGNAAYAPSVASFAGIGTSPYYNVATSAGPGAAAAGRDTTNSYTITATSQGSQTADAGCQVLSIWSTVGTVSYMAGTNPGTLADAASDATAARCWDK
jgi:type IV pilus assembly protein PilE